VALTLTPSGQS